MTQKTKILLVENSSIILQIEKRYLKHEGAAVSTAGDGEGGLAAARRLDPDLIYLACSLPDMDGAAVCKALKADPELGRIPVVMVSNATEEETVLCRAAGCDALVTKPIDRQAFLEAGRALLTRTRRHEARTPCRAIVACILDGTTHYGTIEDISMRGMFVGTALDAAPGTQIVLKFVLPWSGAALVETAARVTWQNGGRTRRTQRLPQGFGLLFLEMGHDAEEQLKSYLETCRLRLGR